MRGSTNDLRYWKDGTRIRPTPEDESEYARFGTFPSWPGPKPDVFISGFCLCGHHWSEHHDDRAECEFYGSNEEGGLDAQGWRHVSDTWTRSKPTSAPCVTGANAEGPGAAATSRSVRTD